jgi:chromosomal replication initiation ATPase DnaA
MANQLWFDLSPADSGFSEDNFCYGHSNSLAKQALLRWQSWSLGALILVGPLGCGKSHLSEIWRGNNNGRILSSASIPLRDTGNFVIEDVDGQLDEEGLFHLLNRAMNDQSKVLLTARNGPSSWRINLGDLRSRINAIEMVRIEEPDEQVLGQMLKKLGKDRSLRLNDKLIRYLVERMERSSQSALRLIENLNARSLETSRPVNRALAKLVLNDMQETPELLGLMSLTGNQ